MRRPHRVRYRRRNTQLRGIPLIVLILAVTAGVALAIGFRTLRPALAAYAENLIQYRVTTAMEDAVSEAIAEHGAELSSLSSLSVLLLGLSCVSLAKALASMVIVNVQVAPSIANADKVSVRMSSVTVKRHSSYSSKMHNSS